MVLNFDVLLGIPEKPEQLVGHWTSLVPGSGELFQHVASQKLEHQSSQPDRWKRRPLDTVQQLQKYRIGASPFIRTEWKMNPTHFAETVVSRTMMER